MDLGLDQRVYVVTGGSKGLGRATVDVLVAEGARVVASGRDPGSLAAVTAAYGEQVVAVQADNADAATPGRLIETAQARWGRVDGALVSVGGPPYGGVLDVDDEAWRGAFETVFLGAVRLGRELAAALGAGGAIGFVLSSSVRSPIPGLAVSNGLRPGLAMVAKTLADEVGPRGVRVVSLLPGRIETERTAALDATAEDPAEQRRTSEAGIALRRYGRPEEFGRVAAFVLSPAASYLTGTALAVDGGALRTL
jgi:3-oxoacyl-[acyl-carrier protein] reductase